MSTVVDQLNELMRMELEAAAHYLLAAERAEDLGFKAIHEKFENEAKEELHHAKYMADRIYFLGGVPSTLTRNYGGDIAELLNTSLSLEQDAVTKLKAAISNCGDDYATRSMLVDILKTEEEAVEFLKGQQELASTLGQQNYHNYLALQVKEE